METNPLTSRELEVLRIVAAGQSNVGIAAKLAVSPLTVERHVQNICSKIGVHNRVDAVTWARRNGLL